MLLDCMSEVTAQSEDATSRHRSLSIAMATFNGERFLQQQLDSLLRQTVLPAELVVTDDGSTDSTLKLLSAFQATAPFKVSVVQNSCRLGYRANFMRCISMCTSDVVALCDQDDVWDPRKIETALAALTQHNALLFFHDSMLIDAENRPIGLSNINQLPEVNPPGSFYPLKNPFGYSIVFRRELLRFSHLWEQSLDTNDGDERMAHDQWIFFLASVLGTIVCSPLPLVHYRQHGANLYGWNKRYTYKQYFADLLRNRHKQFLNFAAVAERRSRIAEQISSMVSGAQARAAQEAQANYQTLAQLWQIRADVYASNSVLKRIKAPLALLRHGGYAKHNWGFGRRMLIKDILASLLHPFLIA